MKPKIIFLLLLLPILVKAQNISIDQGGTLYTCNAVFKDNPATANYSNNAHQIITICPSDSSRYRLKSAFSLLYIDPLDTLFIFDGRDTLSPSISAGPVNGFYFNDHNNLFNTSIYSGKMNTSGCLTFKFVSDSTVSNQGWIADISCFMPCQNINLTFDSTLMNCNTGYILNNCFGTSVQINTQASFTENDLFYHQDSVSTRLFWNFGDNVQDSTSGFSATHNYSTPGLTKITVYAKDRRNCRSSSGQIFVLNYEGKIFLNTMFCPGNRLELLSRDLSSQAIIKVLVNQYDYYTFKGPKIIPDPLNCPQQCLTVNYLSGGADTIRSANDIVSVCLNMEHSYMGDLSFRLTCPGGRSILLDSNTLGMHYGGKFLGVPYGGTDYEQYDLWCGPSSNPAGTGWNYCWSQDYNTPPSHTFESQGSGTGTLDSTNTANNTNYFFPSDNFSSLIGCPIGGIWQIEVCDNLGIDNGYLFNWNIKFKNSEDACGCSLMQTQLSNLNIAGLYWSERTDTSAILITESYRDTTLKLHVKFNITDKCVIDTAFPITIVNVPPPMLGKDTAICGDYYRIESPVSYVGYLWTDGSSLPYLDIWDSGRYSLAALYSTPAGSCWTYDTISVTFKQKGKLRGSAFYQSAQIRSGEAELYEYAYPQYISTADLATYPVFTIMGALDTSYLLKIIPYSAPIPAFYYPSELWWEKAALIKADCDTMITGLNSIFPEIRPYANGYGTITGNIYVVYGQDYIIPGTGIPVILYNEYTDTLMDYRIADTAGFYKFDHLPFGKYKVVADQTCYPVINPHIIEYRVGDSYFADRNFYVIPEVFKIFTENTYSIDEPSESAITIYPNPARYRIYIDARNLPGNNITIELINCRAELIGKSISQDKITALDIAGLNSGLYIIRMIAGNEIVIRKFIKN